MSSDVNTVRVALDPEDVVALQAYYFKHTRPGRRRDRILKTGPLLLAVAWAWSVREHPDWGIDDPMRYALYIGIGIPIILAASWGSLWYLRPTVTRWSVNSGPRKRMLEPLTITLSEDHIALETEHGKGTVQWNEVRHVGHTAEHAFILFAGPNGFVIPRRCFESEQAYASFVAMAERPRPVGVKVAG